MDEKKSGAAAWTNSWTVSYDRDLGAGWVHLTAVRRRDRLELYVNGRQRAVSSAFDGAAYDLSTTAPLRIGFGEMDYFMGRIREVRLYRRAFDANETKGLYDDGRRFGFVPVP